MNYQLRILIKVKQNVKLWNTFRLQFELQVTLTSIKQIIINNKSADYGKNRVAAFIVRIGEFCNTFQLRRARRAFWTGKWALAYRVQYKQSVSSPYESNGSVLVFV